MPHDKVVRAWKDPIFRASLSSKELEQIPENPIGGFELTKEELRNVVGGSGITGCGGGTGTSSAGSDCFFSGTTCKMNCPL
jgi:mersacidin/lichenicidin family type 2 lantibiotic